jgi:hypothetical protein
MYDPNRKANQWYANSSCSSNVSHVSHPFTCSHRDDRGKPKLSLRAVETGPLMLSQKWALKMCARVTSLINHTLNGIIEVSLAQSLNWGCTDKLIVIQNSTSSLRKHRQQGECSGPRVKIVPCVSLAQCNQNADIDVHWNACLIYRCCWLYSCSL